MIVESVSEIAPRARSFLLPGGPEGVLLLHGFSGSIDTLRPLAGYLHVHGFTVLGARLAGHGSTETALESSSRNDWRRSAAEAYDQLHRRCDRIALVGDSVGAILALELSVAHPEVEAVVALNPAVEPRNARWNRLLLPVLRRFVRFRNKPWVSPERRVEHLARGSSVRVPLKAYGETLALAREARRVIPRVSVPLLTVHAEQDPTTHPAGARFLHRHARSEPNVLHWVPEHIHHVVDVKDPQPLYAEILRFLSKQSGLR